MQHHASISERLCPEPVAEGKEQETTIIASKPGGLLPIRLEPLRWQRVLIQIRMSVSRYAREPALSEGEVNEVVSLQIAEVLFVGLPRVLHEIGHVCLEGAN